MTRHLQPPPVHTDRQARPHPLADAGRKPTPARAARSLRWGNAGRFGALVLLAAAGAGPARAADLPWLPPRASGTLSVQFAEASAETFYGQPAATELGFGALDTETVDLRFTYALGDNWAIDASAGEVAAFAPVLGTASGATDVDLGLIWRPVNEQVSPGAPSVALRVGWIGAGNYPTDRVHAPGGASGGYAVSLAVGKVFREALSFSAIIGNRAYTAPVPGVLSAQFTAALLSQPATLQRILGGMEGGMIFRVSYRHEVSAGDLDVGDPYLPEIEPGRFPELARELSRAAAGIAVAAGPVEVAAEAFRYMDGRNVGALDGVSVRLTIKADLPTLLGLL